MSAPPTPFFMDGPCEDLGYLNIRDHPNDAEDKRFVEELWSRFHQLADPHFCEQARNHFLERFWEMYLAVALLEHGFNLYRHGDEGPEFCALVGNSRIWFEAIAPGPGNGPDKVPQLIFSDEFSDDVEFSEVPTEKILLRFTNALTVKRERYAAALKKGIISDEDSYVLAINSQGIRHAPYGNSMPYFIQAFLPFGPPTVSIDAKTLEVKDSFYQYRPGVLKLCGENVSTRTFLDKEAAFCSAVLHSGVDCANHPNQLGGEFSILHNPNARRPLDAAVFQWCEQFTFRDDQLLRSKPNPAVNKDASQAASQLR
jgi:hypothetical protein